MWKIYNEWNEDPHQMWNICKYIEKETFKVAWRFAKKKTQVLWLLHSELQIHEQGGVDEKAKIMHKKKSRNPSREQWG